MSTVYLNIGSNKGHRHALIEQAVALISKAYPDAELRRSSFVESEPWGFESPYKFLNIGIALDFANDVQIQTLLTNTQNIERSISSQSHRNADGSYRDRYIDIDIIAVDKIIINLPNLIVPHPRAYMRDFVMEPLRQLAPPDVVDFVAHISYARKNSGKDSQTIDK